jgi:hypothetical protein
MLLDNTEQLLEICLGIFNQSKDLEPSFRAAIVYC